MTSVLAAGGLLEGLARGTAALAPASPACQALSHILTQACTQSQCSPAPSETYVQQQAANDSADDSANDSVHDSADDSVNATLDPTPGLPQHQQAGHAIQQGAAAIACCQTWQVSVATRSGHLHCCPLHCKV